MVSCQRLIALSVKALEKTINIQFVTVPLVKVRKHPPVPRGSLGRFREPEIMFAPSKSFQNERVGGFT